MRIRNFRKLNLVVVNSIRGIALPRKGNDL